MDGCPARAATQEDKDGVYSIRHGLDSNAQTIQETENRYRINYTGRL
jgi:hypothetical protein